MKYLIYFTLYLILNLFYFIWKLRVLHKSFSSFTKYLDDYFNETITFRL